MTTTTGTTTTGLIRTLAATIAGVIIAYAARTPIFDWVGVDSVTARDRVALVATALLSGAWYAAVRWLEAKIPATGWLLGLRRQVTFTKPPPAS